MVNGGITIIARFIGRSSFQFDGYLNGKKISVIRTNHIPTRKKLGDFYVIRMKDYEIKEEVLNGKIDKILRLK